MRTSLAVVIAGTALMTGCSRGEAEGGGSTVSRQYRVGDFQQVELAGRYDVEIRTGGPVSVSAEGPENVLDHLRVEVHGDKLTIGPKNSSSWFHFGHRFASKSVHVRVTVPTLTGATLAGSGVINIDKVQGSTFDGTVAGSGQLNVKSVNVQTLKLNIAGSGNAKAAEGSTQSAELSIAGSGSLDAAAVQSQQVKVSIAGSGGVRANARSTADVNIMGSGDVEISGGAKCNISKAGSGNVRCS